MKRLILIIMLFVLGGCCNPKSPRGNGDNGFADYIPWWADTNRTTNSITDGAE